MNFYRKDKIINRINYLPLMYKFNKFGMCFKLGVIKLF